MSFAIRFTKILTVASVQVATVYAAARVAFRGRRAWQNMKVIQSVDTGSVWTTE